MSTVTAGLTVSVDGYYVGPDDGPGCGLGVGGERLHHWVFGGPWTYEHEPEEMKADGADQAFLEESMARLGAVICGRATYESAEAWGGSNPWDGKLFVVTRRVEDQPPADQGFTFVPDVPTALEQAIEAAGEKVVNVMGGGHVIREAFRAGAVDELYVSTAPVLLGRGKRLFDDLDIDLNLEKLQVWDSPLATHVRYRVVR